MSYTTLVPANGRDYKSKKKCLIDWIGDKDFVIQCMAHPDNGRHINRTCTKVGEKYEIRFDGLRKFVIVEGGHSTPVPEPEEHPKRYAVTCWCAGDVQSLRPQMSQRQAEEFLAKNAKHIQEAAVTAGWRAIETALSYDGL